MDLLDETKISNLHLVDIRSEQQRVAGEKMDRDQSLYKTLNA